MRLTISRDPRRRGLRIYVERALDYPPGHLPGLLAAAVTEALTQPPTADEVELAEWVPAPRAALDDQEPAIGDAHREADNPRLRRAVLRALDDGHTVEQAAREFGVDPAQVDQWDDDPAIGARTDLLAGTAGWPAPAGS